MSGSQRTPSFGGCPDPLTTRRTQGAAPGARHRCPRLGVRTSLPHPATITGAEGQLPPARLLPARRGAPLPPCRAGAPRPPGGGGSAAPGEAALSPADGIPGLLRGAPVAPAPRPTSPPPPPSTGVLSAGASCPLLPLPRPGPLLLLLRHRRPPRRDPVRTRRLCPPSPRRGNASA